MTYRGDFNVGATIRFMWNTFAVAGESITRATNGTISVYKDGGTTQSTVGVTDTEDFDSLAGVHYVAIDTSADGTFYSAGSDFAVVLSGATVDGKSINAVLAEFSIRNRSALMPTTAGRTLDVSAGGEAGLDWANIGSPTTAINLSGTNIDTDQVVASVTAGVTVSDKTGFSLSAAGISAIWSNATRTLTSFGTLASQIWNYTPRSLDTWELLVEGIWTNAARTLTTTADSAGVTTLLSRIGAALSFTSGRVNAQVGGMDADTLTAAAVAADAAAEIGGGGGATAGEIADAVLDELLSGHTTSGSLAAAISTIEGKTALLGSASAQITQAVIDESGDLIISKGKDYKGSRAPSWSRTITYAGATISAGRLNVGGLSITGSITNSGGVVTVSADISRTAFDGVAPGVYPFEVELDLTVGLNTEVVQFTTGKCRVSTNL